LLYSFDTQQPFTSSAVRFVKFAFIICLFMKGRWSNWFLFLSLFVSQTVQAQWIESNNGIYGGTITALANYNGNVFAGTWGGIYHSNDNAGNWKPFNAGLNNTFVNAMAVSSDGKVFLATNGGSRMFTSSEPFTGWTTISTGLPQSPVTTLAVIDNQVYGNTSDGLLFTLMQGNTSWTLINAGIGSINSISSSGENLFAATDDGVYLSTDRGLNWKAMNNGLIEKSIYAISTVNNYVIAKARIGLTFFSKDEGKTWSLATLDGSRYKLVKFKDVLYAANEFQMSYTTNEGKTWESVNNLPGARDMIVNGSTLIAGNPYGIYSSTNTFQWTNRNYGNLTNARIVGLASSANHVFCITGRGDIFRSNNLGKSWTLIKNGLPVAAVTAIGYFDNTLFVALSNYGIFRSDNEGTSWSFAGGIVQVTSFARKQNQLIAGSKNGVYVSSDAGRTWTRLTNSPQPVEKLRLLVRGDTLFTVTPEYGVSFSVNNGQSWTSINEGIPIPARLTSLASFRGSILVGAENADPVYIRDTISSPWKSASTGLSDSRITVSFASDGQQIFAAGDGGVYRSTTSNTWAPFYNELLPILSSPQGVESLIVYRNHLFAGTEAYGVWISCLPPPRPTISIIGNAPNDTTLISDAPEGNQWYLNDMPIAGATQPTYKPAVSGNYSVKLWLNDCEGEMSEAVNIFIKEYPDVVIEMPNIFTPNDDMYNPMFVPIHYQDVSTAEIKILDRWGQEIFQSDDVPGGWNGGNFPPGVYYYRITYTGKNGKTGKVNGWVHLIR